MKNRERKRAVTVLLDGREVGTLAETVAHKYAFAYSREWLECGFPISPFSLPLEDRVFVPAKAYFDGLFGVFADSLPDAWGQLLVDRMLEKHGRAPGSVSPLERLSIVGSSGMGALCYRPAQEPGGSEAPDDLDALSEECRRLLNHEEVGALDRLFSLGGSSGGARPKVMTEEWIIKFPASRDDPNSGAMEKAYMDCAAACGIEVPETRLLPSQRCAGYFSTRRFDRERRADGTMTRRHMLTAAAILELDWRVPSLDYHALMKLTKILCLDAPDDLRQMYLRMCFNVFAHNRDDHAKNFTFIYDAAADRWRLSPAYDLTWSDTYYGEHTTTVDGNGRDPGLAEVVNVGVAAGLSRRKCQELAGLVWERTAGLRERYGKIGR